MDIQESMTIWRYPACPHTYATSYCDNGTIRTLFNRRFGSDRLAQSVERWTINPGVVGLFQGRPSFFKQIRGLGGVFFRTNSEFRERFFRTYSGFRGRFFSNIFRPSVLGAFLGGNFSF